MKNKWDVLLTRYYEKNFIDTRSYKQARKHFTRHLTRNPNDIPCFYCWSTVQASISLVYKFVPYYEKEVPYLLLQVVNYPRISSIEIFRDIQNSPYGKALLQL